jgi:hypothetical protein
MTYTVWSRGELIGESDLDFRGLGFDRCRSGHFIPNARGLALMDDLASDSHCMRAYMHRDYRDADGNGLISAEYMGSDWFGDVAEHLHETAEFALVLRDANNHVVPTEVIGIQDKEPDWPPPLTDDDRSAILSRVSSPSVVMPSPLEQPDQSLLHELNERHKEPLSPFDAQLLRDKFDAHMAQEFEEEQDDIAFNESICMPGHETSYTPLDITRPVGWGYDETQGDNELGSGWNETLRDLPNFPRYQLHVMLAEGATVAPPSAG